MARKSKNSASKQVLMLELEDKHWYKEAGEDLWLPSVSEVLGSLKDGLEFVSPYDLRIAAERGIKLHKACELLEQGEKLQKGFYSYKEWEMLGGFINWHQDFPGNVPIFSEKKLASHKLGFGGTLDRLYMIMVSGKRTLVDIKTTSAIYDKHWLQVAAYAKLLEEIGEKVDETAILRLTEKTKKRYQYEVDVVWKESYKVFDRLLGVYKHFNPTVQPRISVLPDELSLELSTELEGYPQKQ